MKMITAVNCHQNLVVWYSQFFQSPDTRQHVLWCFVISEELLITSMHCLFALNIWWQRDKIDNLCEIQSWKCFQQHWTLVWFMVWFCFCLVWFCFQYLKSIMTEGKMSGTSMGPFHCPYLVQYLSIQNAANVILLLGNSLLFAKPHEEFMPTIKAVSSEYS